MASRKAGNLKKGLPEVRRRKAGTKARHGRPEGRGTENRGFQKDGGSRYQPGSGSFNRKHVTLTHFSAGRGAGRQHPIKTELIRCFSSLITEGWLERISSKKLGG